MNILLKKEQLSEAAKYLNETSGNVVYTAIFVDSNELKQKYKPIYPNEFYHHSTIEFKPKNISGFPTGKSIKLHIIGRLTTNKVDVLLVDNPLSKSKYPHITLSTEENIKPFESNSEIENNLDKVKPLDDAINGIYGFFDGRNDITENKNQEITPVTKVRQGIIAYESKKILITNNQLNEIKSYFSNIDEGINLDVSTGDTVMMGKFKNKKVLVKSIGKDIHNMPTINGKQAATFRTSKMNEVTSDKVSLSSFKGKKELNDKIWDGDKLRPAVRKILLKISDDFLEDLGIDIKNTEDVLFIGSLTNYLWSKYSDIDMHIIVDFKKINKDISLVKDYFDSKKKIWNDNHESLKIYGFPVEIYVQDANEKNASTSIFSLEKNRWIKKPDIENSNIDYKDRIKEKASSIMTEIDDLCDAYKTSLLLPDIKKIAIKSESIYNKIKKLRKSGLSTEAGETSVGNIVFKVLRRAGYIEKIIGLKTLVYNKINSLA